MEIDLEKSGELSVWIRTRSITGKLGKGTGNIRGGKLMIPYL
jgi:hypothetical protein